MEMKKVRIISLIILILVFIEVFDSSYDFLQETLKVILRIFLGGAAAYLFVWSLKCRERHN